LHHRFKRELEKRVALITVTGDVSKGLGLRWQAKRDTAFGRLWMVEPLHR
jgi:hypothetical protein